MTAFADFLSVTCGNWQCVILCEKIAVVKQRVSFMVQHGQRFWGLMLQSLNIIQYSYTFRGVILSIYPGNWFLRIFVAHEINAYGFMAQHGTYLMVYSRPMKSSLIIFSHFSLPLKSLSAIFMARGMYNTPTFQGSWTLVADISWQFHEPWNGIDNFS